MNTTTNTAVHMSPAQHRSTAVWLQQFDKAAALRIIENLRADNIANSNCDRLAAFVNSNRFGTLS